MSRMKTFGIYLLIFVVFYIFSSLIAYGYIQSTYKKISGEVIKDDNFEIKINNSEATLVNGYIEGTITNSSDKQIDGKYIRIELFSARNNKILTKYVNLETIGAGETKNFKVNFRAENITKFYVEIADEIKQEETKTQIVTFSNLNNDENKGIAVFAAFFILAHYFI